MKKDYGHIRVGSESDKPYLDNMVGMPITLYVGENDAVEWVSETEQTAQILDSLGATVTYKIWVNDGHVITSLKPQFLFDLFDTYRQIDRIFPGVLRQAPHDPLWSP